MTLPPVLAKARARLVVTTPFYGSIALGLRWSEDPSVTTMATDGRTIFYDPTWCETIGIERSAGVIAHEVLHVVNRHHLRLGGRDPHLWNVAADLVINRVLTEGGFALPADGLHDHASLHAGLPVETVYARLQQEHGQGGSRGQEERPQPAWGEVRQAVNAAGRPLTATEQATAEGEIDVRVRQALAAARRAGKLPASLRLLVEATSSRSNWRDRFRCLSDGLLRHELSWAKPNRRFLPHGLYLPSAARAGIGTIAVVLDTSGSITEPELARYTGEVLALLEEALPDELLLIQCDDAVRSVLHLRPGDELGRIEVEGRGGTRFQPAFDWIALHTEGVRAIVYMTDLLYSDRPRDPGLPVIWLTPATGRSVPFGEVVEVAI
jgi:predicted metal-dependent peptidase